MLIPYVYIGILFLLFFILIPAAGAFQVRGRWRRFRALMLEASVRPFIRYSDTRRVGNGCIGTYRFFGFLEAIREDTIWLRNQRLTINARMSSGTVYLLPSQEATEKEGRVENNVETLPEENPKRLVWNSIFSLPQGTSVYITGALFAGSGEIYFENTRDVPLVVVIYDGDTETILRRSIWSGRHKNEYWNQFTLPSLVVGFFSLLAYAYILYRNPMMRQQVIVAVTACVLPIAVFLPPGIFGFFIYKSFWKRARILRAERDLLLLPMKHFQYWDPAEPCEISMLDSGEVYGLQRRHSAAEEEVLAAMPEMKVRSSSAVSVHRRNGDGEAYLFGVPLILEEGHVFLQPLDPMAECVFIPGNPEELSSRCAGQARRFEYFALASFVVGLCANVLLIYALLHFIIR
jgi:hypothetical protein